MVGDPLVRSGGDVEVVEEGTVILGSRVEWRVLRI